MDKFRSARVPRHIRIYHDQLNSVAWKRLSGGAVKVLLALASLELGENNGAFFMSARKGAELTGLGKNAVCRALRELQEKGFIYCAELGGFSRKTPHAARYGLTWVAGPKESKHRAPTHAYKKWQPANNRGLQKRDSAVAQIDTLAKVGASHCIDNGDRTLSKVRGNPQNYVVSKTGTHNSYQGIPPANDNALIGPTC